MTRANQYGPHRPEDAPNAVTVLGPGKWPNPEVRPIPDALIAQRARSNELARQRASGEGHLHPCPVKGAPVWFPSGVTFCLFCRCVITVVRDG